PPPPYQAPSDGPSTVKPQHVRPTFTITCWLMALIAFAQLITVGTALTTRNTLPPQQPTLATVTPPQKPIQPRTLAQILASVGGNPLPPPTNHHTPVQIPAHPAVSPAIIAPPPAHHLPAIADPRVERLVQESRSLHMDGDMMRAMLKLDEAERIDPTEPAVTYQKAMLFEDMGIYIKAADHYQKIQQMGNNAGTYFKLAAAKLTQGMDTAVARRNVISIGPMQTRKSRGPEGVKQADVAITILARPDQPINPSDVHVQIHFYDKVNGGEIKKATASATIDSSWADPKLDWKDAGNEECLHVSYTVPTSDLADEHLLGRREFYGYVVELLYKGEVIDQQAHPRRLHSVHGSKFSPIPQDSNPLPWLPDQHDTLLPSKDHGYGNNPSLPPLPER
ncbi:MAG: hypothetical protein KJO21_09040, partial [Verrucomicrobiae bacterium]|nr:hypothetical protein [Verrucomicrobiae bacterium]NNJ42319.1 hypothetical protein [Akkermansiaceae bacterium]